jgi:Universal stress protein family.
LPAPFPGGEGGIQMKKVVVAIEGSEANRGVVDYAIHYANREPDAEMLFLHVIDLSEYKPVFYGERDGGCPAVRRRGKGAVRGVHQRGNKSPREDHSQNVHFGGDPERSTIR